eukprot:3876711-Prymnesium_polylepis.1
MPRARGRPPRFSARRFRLARESASAKQARGGCFTVSWGRRRVSLRAPPTSLRTQRPDLHNFTKESLGRPQWGGA